MVVALDVDLVRHVALVDLAGVAVEPGFRRLEALPVHVEQDHLRARLEQDLRHSLADRARTAGDQGHLARESVLELKLSAETEPGAEEFEKESSRVEQVRALLRAVAARDQRSCAFVSPSGRRCSSRDRLEFHHKHPWARSKRHSVDGIELRCRAHNHHAAVQDFGAAHMARCRASADVDG